MVVVQSVYCEKSIMANHILAEMRCCCLWIVVVDLVQQGVLDGKYDDLPEQSFYMVGGIDEVIAKAEKIAKESAA